MRFFIKLFLIIITVSIWGCKEEESSAEKALEDFFEDMKNSQSQVSYEGSEMSYPELKGLTEYPNTAFVPTLENKITKNKNAIYCVTFLYAWEGIRNKLKTPIKLTNASYDLSLLNNSKSYINVLDSTEYKVDSKLIGDSVFVKADFDKSLPFEYSLKPFDNKLNFGDIKVKSFGVIGENYGASFIIDILYYSDDNNFIIKLNPKDDNHEIILFKTTDEFSSMSDLVSLTNKYCEIGNEENSKNINSWKYRVDEDDEVIIPKLKFNIEQNYESIENKWFKSNNRDYLIIQAWQKNSFILYEKGAGIKSSSEIIYALSASLIEEEPRPQKIVFDKPFFLMLKRKDSKNPYFAIWVSNSELMIKE